MIKLTEQELNFIKNLVNKIANNLTEIEINEEQIFSTPYWEDITESEVLKLEEKIKDCQIKVRDLQFLILNTGHPRHTWNIYDYTDELGILVKNLQKFLKKIDKNN